MRPKVIGAKWPTTFDFELGLNEANVFKLPYWSSRTSKLWAMQVRPFLQLRVLERVLELPLGGMHVLQEGADVSAVTSEATNERYPDED